MHNQVTFYSVTNLKSFVQFIALTLKSIVFCHVCVYSNLHLIDSVKNQQSFVMWVSKLHSLQSELYSLFSSECPSYCTEFKIYSYLSSECPLQFTFDSVKNPQSFVQWLPKLHFLQSQLYTHLSGECPLQFTSNWLIQKIHSHLSHECLSYIPFSQSSTVFCQVSV